MRYSLLHRAYYFLSRSSKYIFHNSKNNNTLTSSSSYPIYSSRRPLSSFHHSSIFKIHPEVQNAIEKGYPVVALESTIISHGMPYPNNFETALMIESMVRENGSVPATIAIFDEKIHVGLEKDQLKRLALTGLKAHKTSRRDLPLVLARKNIVGATTVAGTMVIADKIGIKVFVTGGIGGVHRGAEQTMDISADLTELGRTPVGLVCAGVKSILDIEKTLEYLETQGVTVTTLGSNEFPAFFARSSGFKSPIVSDNIEDCAQILRANSKLSLKSGTVIAVPIPVEDEIKDVLKLNKVIAEALSQAKDQGISGKDITPFLLDRVKNATQGDSLRANIALVKNNAKIGSQIAKRLAELTKKSNNVLISSSSSTITLSRDDQNSSKNLNSISSEPLIIGATNLDITSTLYSTTTSPIGTSSPGHVHQSLGGVGRNIAEAVYRTGGGGRLCSTIGQEDEHYLEPMKHSGMNLDGIKRDIECEDVNSVHHKRNGRKGGMNVYNAVLGYDGELIVACADLNEDNISGEQAVHEIRKQNPNIVCLDGNLSISCIQDIWKECHVKQIPVFFEPTSAPKSIKIFKAFSNLHELKSFHQFMYASPNIRELIEMSKYLQSSYPTLHSPSVLPSSKSTSETYHLFPNLSVPYDFTNHIDILSQYFHTLFIKLGSKGILLCQRNSNPVMKNVRNNENENGKDGIHVKLLNHEICLTYFEPYHVIKNAVSVTGAGDTFVGTVLTGLSLQMNGKFISDKYPNGLNLNQIVRGGMNAAEKTLMSEKAVSEEIGPWVFTS